jgi:hypothetical protein
MVGRDAELGQLAALLPLLRAGRGRMAVIIGEPGSARVDYSVSFVTHGLGRRHPAGMKGDAFPTGEVWRTTSYLI